MGASLRPATDATSCPAGTMPAWSGLLVLLLPVLLLRFRGTGMGAAELPGLRWSAKLVAAAAAAAAAASAATCCRLLQLLPGTGIMIDC